MHTHVTTNSRSGRPFLTAAASALALTALVGPVPSNAGVIDNGAADGVLVVKGDRRRNAIALRQERPHRGRPRSENSRRAILDAASQLLTERGLDAISTDAVAERAGASKATIYRWWSSNEILALDALYAEWDTAPAGSRDTGSLRGDLRALIRPSVRLLACRPFGGVIATFVTKAQSDPEFAETYRAHFVEPRRQVARDVLTRAIERGEISANTDIELALDLLYGPFYHWLLRGHEPLSQRFADNVVDHVVAAVKHAGT